MESFITVSILLSVTAAAVIACLAIYNRKRQSQTQLKVPEEAQPTAITPEQPLPPQEPQATLEEKAEQTCAEETPLTPVKEAQPRAIQEAQLTETSPPTAGEETRLLAAEEVQLTSLEVTRPAPESKQLEPGKRGGRPRIPSQGRRKQLAPETKSRALKPEIVCSKRERQWVLAVEVPGKLLGKLGLTVLQNGVPLSQDGLEETYWCLNQVSGEVIVRWNEDEAVQEAKVEIGHNGYLLFKLSGRDLDQGRLVKSPSSGAYLAMVPEDWGRDETLSGLPPAAPEPVFFIGYQAHFFDLEKNSHEKIAFRLPDGQPLVIESKAPRFELVGTQLGDASNRMGPLFGSDLPRIRALDTQAWESVATIVVGEEGSGRGRWRTEFAPAPGRTEQNLPSELARRKRGWYFLRFYNADDDLIESLDFRFISCLKQIVLPQSRPLPSEDGHRPVHVKFLHEPDCSVQAVESPVNVQIDHQHDKTIVTIPPDPTCDWSHWSVCPKDGVPIGVFILVERIWWALAEEDSQPSQWIDKPIKLSHEDFAATSRKALWFRFPQCRWVDKVLLGFEQSKAQPYNVRVTEKTVVVPLRGYGDSAEVGYRTQEYRLRLWIKREHQDMEGVIAVLPASHHAESRPCPSWCGVGRKKTAIARAAMQNGAGEIKVNGRRVDDYFRQTPRKTKPFLERLLDLKEVREVLSQKEMNITVEGSSPTTMRQAKAVAHAIARALMSYDPNLTAVLKQAGFGGIKVKHSEASGRGER